MASYTPWDLLARYTQSRVGIRVLLVGKLTIALGAIGAGIVFGAIPASYSGAVLAGGWYGGGLKSSAQKEWISAENRAIPGEQHCWRQVLQGSKLASTCCVYRRTYRRHRHIDCARPPF